MQNTRFAFLSLLTVLTAALPAFAAPKPAPDAAPPGLALTFQSLAPGAPPDAADTRPARLVALSVPAGTPPSSFTPAGPFRATWEGDVAIPLRGDYTFSATGRGKLKVTLNDKIVLRAGGDDFAQAAGNPVTLKKGKNHLVAVYDSPAAGDADVRLLWSSDDFRPEPPAPTLYSHPAGDALAKSDQLRRGRELLADLRCVRCHAAPELADAMKADPVRQAAELGTRERAGGYATPLPIDLKTQAMPELAIDAPDLSAVGARLNQSWVEAWINDPRALRPDASMPRLFHAPANTTATEARDLAAYLSTLTGDAKPAAATTADNPQYAPADAEAGGRLVATLGCVVCHTLPDAAPEPADARRPGLAGPRVPLKYVKAKYQPAALEAFLRNPQAHYQWIRMPNFRFSPAEAKSVAAYLLTASGPLPPPNPGKPGDRARGEQLFHTAGCLNCHPFQKAALPAPRPDAAPVPASGNLAPSPFLHDQIVTTVSGGMTAPAFAAIPAVGWSRGCMAADEAARGKAPDFGLDDARRAALAAFAALPAEIRLASLRREALPEFVERSITSLRCIGCHSRDGASEQWSDLAKETRHLLPGGENHPASAGGTPAPAASANAGAGAGAGAVGEDQMPSIEGGDQYRPPLTYTGEKLRPEWAAPFIAGQVDYKPRYFIAARMPGFPARATLLAAGMALEHGCPPTSPADAKTDDALAKDGSTLVGRNGGFSCISCHGVGPVPPLAPFEAPAINFMYVKERIRRDYFDRWVMNPARYWPGTKMPAFADADAKTPIKDLYEGDAVKQFDAVWNYLLAGREVKHPEADQK